MNEIPEVFTNVPYCAVELGIALLLPTLILAVNTALTHFAELRRSGEGNGAAAAIPSGVNIGFAATLVRMVAQCSSLFDRLAWLSNSLEVRRGADVAVRMLVPAINRNIESGQVASGALLGTVAIALELLHAPSIG